MQTSKDCTTQNVTNGTVRAEPHLLKLEFFNSLFIRGDGGTLDTNLVLLNGVGSINGDLVIGSVSVFNTQIKILDINIKIGGDKLG